jgi:hypothetical protein
MTWDGSMVYGCVRCLSAHGKNGVFPPGRRDLAAKEAYGQLQTEIFRGFQANE